MDKESLKNAHGHKAYSVFLASVTQTYFGLISEHAVILDHYLLLSLAGFHCTLITY